MLRRCCQALCSGAQRKDKSQWAQTGTQEVLWEEMLPYCEHDQHSLPMEFVESPLKAFQSHLDMAWAASSRQSCFIFPAVGQMTSTSPFQPQPFCITSVIQYPCSFQSWKKEITPSDTSLFELLWEKNFCAWCWEPLHVFGALLSTTKGCMGTTAPYHRHALVVLPTKVPLGAAQP